MHLIFKSNKLALLLASSLFLFLGDAILSYLFPVIVEETVHSFTLVGMILATSSLAGLTFDLLFPILFPNLDWKTSNLIGIVLALTFPILLFLGQDLKQPIFFIISAIVWGIYYEFLGFSRQDSVVELDKEKNFTQTWSIIYTFLAFCAFIGPIFASITLGADQFVARAIVFILYFIAIVLSFALVRTSGTEKPKRESKLVHAISFFKEMKYWAVLESRAYPVLILLVFLTIINSFFWTFGGLYGEELFGGNGFGWILLVVYTLPDLIFSLAFSRVLIKRRKKFLSFILLTLAGISVLPLMVTNDNYVLLSLVFVFSGLNAMIWILMRAVFSDLESRSEEFQVHMEGIYQSTHSIGYIIGPLLMGFVVDAIGFKSTFILIGLIAILLGIFLLIVTPEKIKIPKKRLRQI